MKIFIGVVLLFAVIYIWRRQKRGQDEFLNSEAADEEKNHVYFQERITTPLRDLFCSDADGSKDSDAVGYYLPDEGIIRIHHYVTYGTRGEGTHHYDIDWSVSSEEEAENAFDTFVDFQEDLLRELDPDIVPHYCEYSRRLTFNGMKLDPDDPEWDWGGSYREAFEDLERTYFETSAELHAGADELIKRFRRMEPQGIAEYVISMMVDGHPRASALDSAVVHFDLDVDDAMYREVLDALIELERRFDHDFWSRVGQNDRAKGILLGLAAGDRNGGPIRMAVRLAESLVDVGRFDLADIGARYLDWWREDAFDTGPTAARVFTLVDSGLSFPAAAQQVHIETGEQTAGCNPAHRSAPLAMMSQLDTQQLADYAKQEAALTHHHPLSSDVASAVVVICHQLVQGSTWEKAIDSACTGRLPETVKAISKPELESLKTGGFAPDVLAAAIYFVGSSESFNDALKRSLQFAGPANHCPVLVGSIAGARWGMSSINRSLLEHCSILSRVQAVAENLNSS